MPCMPFLGVSSLDLGRAVQTCGPFFFPGHGLSARIGWQRDPVSPRPIQLDAPQATAVPAGIGNVFAQCAISGP